MSKLNSSNKIFKNPKILEEGYRDEELLNFSEEIKRLRSKLSNVKKTSFIAFTAPYGSGKTTALNQIRGKTRDQYTNLWMQFDAWKYPNRDSLWENFILDFFREFEPDLFKRALNKIDSDSRSKKTLLKFASGISQNLTPLDFLFDVIEILTGETKIKRVFEIQELFVELLKNSTLQKAKTITIVLEDIDRSGDKGIYFLETLNYFLKNIAKEKKDLIFKVIVPMENHFFYSKDEKPEEKRLIEQSYYKIFDQVWALDLTRVSYKPFVEKLFTNEVKDKIGVDKLGAFFSQLCSNSQHGLVMRELQLHLRHVRDLYNHKIESSEALEWDVRVTLCLEIASFRKEQLLSDSSQGICSQKMTTFLTLINCSERGESNNFAHVFFVNDSGNNHKDKFNIPVYRVPNFSETAYKEGYWLSNKYLRLFNEEI